MTAVVSGGIFNVIFDYILVYPCQMGMAGAAIATVCGSILTVLILLIHFFGKHNHLHFCFSEIRGSFGSDIFKSGFASFLIDLSSGIVSFFLQPTAAALSGRSRCQCLWYYFQHCNCCDLPLKRNLSGSTADHLYKFRRRIPGTDRSCP